MEKRDLIVELLKNIHGGKPVAAAQLYGNSGKSEEKFNRHQYEHKGCRFFDVDELLELQTLSGTALVADYFASKAGCIVVRAPKIEELDNTDLFHRSMKTVLKRGAVDQMIAKALEDGEISSEEAKEIIAVHRKHMAAREEEVIAIIELHKKQSSGCGAAQS